MPKEYPHLNIGWKLNNALESGKKHKKVVFNSVSAI
jgi:hypothetical protein